MFDDALGAAVKKSGLMDTMVEWGRKIPGAKEIIDAVDDRVDAALMKLGMDFESLNLLPAYRDDMIDLTEALNSYTDEEAAALAKIVQADLTVPNESDILESKIELNHEEKGFLQKQFNYIWNGEKQFIPEGAVFEENIVIAGRGSKTTLRVADQLANSHGGNAQDWEKHVGQILSEKYLFDIHWYELNGQQYDVKIKFRKER